MKLKFQDSTNLLLFPTTHTVYKTVSNGTVLVFHLITQKIWVLNEQYHAFTAYIQLGQNRVPCTCRQSMESGGCEI